MKWINNLASETGQLTPMGWGVGLGALGLGALFRRRGGDRMDPSRLYNNMYQPFGQTEAGGMIKNELRNFDRRTEQGLGTFQRVAASGQPTIADFIGASYAQGGTGLRGRQQADQVRRSGLAAATGAYNQYRIGRDSYKGSLLNQMALGQSRQQGLAMQRAGAQNAYEASRPGLGSVLSYFGEGLLDQGMTGLRSPLEKYMRSGQDEVRWSPNMMWGRPI